MNAVLPPSGSAERKCKGCEQIKLMRRCRQYCDDCRPPVAEGEPKKKSGKRTRGTATEDAEQASRWSRPAGLGFVVSLEAADPVDSVRLEQATDQMGEQTIWLNPAEARELHSWLSEKLGL